MATFSVTALGDFTRRKVMMVLLATVASSACSSKPRQVPSGAASGEPEVIGRSWRICTWAGPASDRPGIFGTDLGYEAPLPAAAQGASEAQQLLFGDTFVRATDECKYPSTGQDDLAARIPLAKPESLSPGKPSGAHGDCEMLEYTIDNAEDATSWRRIRVFPDASDHSDARVLDTGLDRTPLTAWGDGTHAFMMFYRDEYPRCDSDAQCPTDMACTGDPGYSGKRVGSCSPSVSLSDDASPVLCLDADDCQQPAMCTDLERGVCVARAPFSAQRDGQTLRPDWLSRDPRDGLAVSVRIASAFWPERPEDYATGFEFVTNKFINVAARTVAHFDPQHPEQNDYRPGYETLLLWGRASFVGHDGYQTLPFLLYQPLENIIDDAGRIAWAPRFFAGYDASGNPAWSDNEADAQPVYGVDENLTQVDGQWRWDIRYPEFDYVNQMSTTFVPELGRWLMLYGGEITHARDPGKDGLPKRTHPQVIPGAFYLRSAQHPWGRAHASDAIDQGFSQPRPVLRPKDLAKDLACREDQPSAECNAELPQTHSDVLSSVTSAITDFSAIDALDATAKCSAGGEIIDSQYADYDEGGHLYGAAIIQSWTTALPDAAPNDPAVELYWNVSTWNPYQALLVKTQLRASDFSPR
jgi:hypothetical protein